MSFPCGGRSPAGWQLMQRGFVRTFTTSENSARDRACGSAILANAEGGWRSLGPRPCESAPEIHPIVISKPMKIEPLRIDCSFRGLVNIATTKPHHELRVPKLAGPGPSGEPVLPRCTE